MMKMTGLDEQQGYKELKARAEAMMKEAKAMMERAEQARGAEKGKVIAGIKARMKEHGITVDDLAWAIRVRRRGPAKADKPAAQA